MYASNSTVESSCAQIYALQNNDYLDNNTMQPIYLDSDRSSDSLTCILNDLNIRYPEDDQTIKMGTDNVSTQKSSDASAFNSTLIQSYEQNAQNFASCPGKKIFLTSIWSMKFMKNIDTSTQ